MPCSLVAEPTKTGMKMPCAIAWSSSVSRSSWVSVSPSRYFSMRSSSASATRSVSFSRAASAAAMNSAGISRTSSLSPSWWYAFIRMMSMTPRKLGLGAHRDLHGADAVAELGVERGHDGVEVGVLLVHAVDEHGAGDAHLAGDLPQTLRLDLRAGDGVDHEQRHLGGLHAGDRVADEVRVAGRVDDVDLHAVVNDGCEREVDRELALDLLGVVVEARVTVIDGAEPLRGAGQIEHRLGERGLARTAVSDENDVADLVSTWCSQVHRLLRIAHCHVVVPARPAPAIPLSGQPRAISLPLQTRANAVLIIRRSDC